MNSLERTSACRVNGWRRVLFIGCFLLGLCLGAGAQAAESENAYVLDSWQTDSGLPHNFITCLEQTRDGYLWLGTSNGLARFDGVRFATYRSTDHPGLRDNSILCLYEDRSGKLWVGTEQGGLATYDKGGFASIGSWGESSSLSVLSLGEGNSGELWVGTASGLNRSDPAKRVFRSELFSGGAVSSILQPQRSGVLFAAHKGVYQVRQGRVGVYEPMPAELRTNTFFCVHQDFERRLWAGGPGGLLRVEGSGEFSLLPASRIQGAAVVALLEAADGGIWFVTSHGGLYKVRSAGARTQAEQSGTGVHPVGAAEGALEASFVAAFPSPATSLLQDNEGNVWVGTAGSGVFRVKRRQLSWIGFPEELAESAAGCVFESGEEGVMLLARNNELFELQGSGFTRRSALPLPAAVVVQTVWAGRTNEVWLGTRRDGLFRIRGEEIHHFSEREGLSDSAITALCGSERGVWVGTQNGGLNLLSADGKVTRFNTPWGFMGAYACVLEPGADGGLWVGTTGDGLFRVSQDGIVGFSGTNGLDRALVHALHADEDGTLWIGTGSGLYRLKEGRMAHLPGPNTAQAEAVVQLRSDAEGNLWTVWSSGIHRYRKEQLNDVADGKARFLDVLRYGREDGLPAVQYMPNILCSSGRLPGRAPLFASARGLVALTEPVLRLNTEPPPVVLEAVLLENGPVSIAGPIKVPAGTANIQFQFTALSLTAPGKVAFRYRLEGLDADWSDTTHIRVARYPRLPPGKYNFRVVARNNDGIWNEAGTSVALLVAPFWWETYWFRLGGVAALGLVAFGLYRMRKQRRREIERLRVKIASDLHDDVGSSLWSITLLSRMLSRQGNLPAQEQHDLGEINRIAVQASNSIRDIIWLINPAFDSLQELVLRVKDSAATALPGVDFHLHCEGVDLSGKLPQTVRQNLLFLLKESLTNVAKHAKATRVELRMEETADHWKFTIEDNGVGFDPEDPRKGNGIDNMRRRAEQLGGSFCVKSSPGEGARLTATVPRPRPHPFLRLPWSGRTDSVPAKAAPKDEEKRL